MVSVAMTLRSPHLRAYADLRIRGFVVEHYFRAPKEIEP
jgi:hypothetical protein